MDLQLLYSQIKKDKESYFDDFKRQNQHFQQLLELFQSSLQLQFSQQKHQDLGLAALCTFIAQCTQYYPKDTQDIPHQLRNMLIKYGNCLDSEFALLILQSFCLFLHNKIPLTQKGKFLELEYFEFMLEYFHFLLITGDPQLKQQKQFLFHWLKKRFTTHQFPNNILQALLKKFNQLFQQNLASSSNDQIFQMLQLLAECWLNHQQWKRLDLTLILLVEQFKYFLLAEEIQQKSLNYLLHFFLFGQSCQASEEEEKKKSSVQPKQLIHRAKITKKTQKAKNDLEKQLKKHKKETKKNREEAQEPKQTEKSPLFLIHDTYPLSDAIYKCLARLPSSHHYLSLRFQLMNCLSLLMGHYQLNFPSFYPLLQQQMKNYRHLQEKEQNLLRLFSFFIQSQHEFQTGFQFILDFFLNEFLQDSQTPHLLTVALHCLAECLERNPNLWETNLKQEANKIDQETEEEAKVTAELDQQLSKVQYLMLFRKHLNKGVKNAAREVLNSFRKNAPHLLPKKERGKEVAMKMQQEAREQSQLDNEEAPELEPIEDEDEQGEEFEETDDEVLEDFDEEELEELEEDDLEEMSEGEQENQNDESETHKVERVKKGPKRRFFLGYQHFQESGQQMDLDYEVDEETYSDLVSDSEDEQMEDDEQEEKSSLFFEPEKLTNFVLHQRPTKQEQLQKIKLNKPLRSLSDKSKNPFKSDKEAPLFQSFVDKQKTEDRELYLSKKRRFKLDKQEKKSSMSNSEKKKKKPFMMMVHKREVSNKKKMSLREKQKRLRSHLERQKKEY